MIHESGIVWTGAAMFSLQRLQVMTKGWIRAGGL